MSEDWPGIAFAEYCVSSGLTETSARYYASHLRRLDQIVGGIDELIASKPCLTDVDLFVTGLPLQQFRNAKDKGNMISVLRKYLDFVDARHHMPKTPITAVNVERAKSQILPLSNQGDEIADFELSDLFHDVRSLAVRYYHTTGKPLGVTGELAELAAAALVGVTLAPARTSGFDGWIERGGQKLRVQIKGRAVPWVTRYVGRCPSIKYGDLFDLVFLVLIDNETMRPREIWEADEASVSARLIEPGSKSRNERNSMGISQFKSIATLIWSADECAL
jgi:hypothetical protein